jgi:WD40 repeat protein/serine/threonine protein kinase
MSNPDPKEERIFEGALGLGAGERGAYLDRECGGDAELRRRVEGLLDALDRAGAFMRAPAAGAAGAGMQREQAGDRIGRYKLLQAIGEGGCGVVYMAEQQEPVRRRVALKVIKLGMDTRQVIARFEAERQALALMDHPNIARVLDAGATDAGRPYFVMELVRGVRITEFCEEHRLPIEERLQLFIQVCHALQHAHQKGVIHRDIKPSNILVSLDDGIPVPKVIDFGIAKATTGQPLTDRTLFTAFEQFLGTPAYMSPEQALVTSVDIDTRSDIYSLGVLLYELLTGHTPFDQKELLAAGLDGMRRTIREKQPPRPSVRLDTLGVKELTTTAERRRTEGPRLLHGVRGDLDWIVMKALEKDRARRYETATGLAADLGRHLNDEPVLARPPSRMYELRKTARRHSLAFAAAAAVVLALASGITLTTWQAVRATRAEQMQVRLRTDAEKARQEAQAEAGRLLEFKKELSTADFLQAQRLLEQDNSNDALAYLAQSFYEDPANRAAATRLATLLAYRSWMIPVTALPHSNRVNWAEYSPDGRRIVTASEDGTAQVWETDTGKAVGEALRHPFGVTQARFSPDGQRMVTASEDATVRMWDLKTGQVMSRPLRHGSPVTSLQFSPDGGRLVTGTATNTTRVWDLATGRSLARWQGQESRKVRVPDPRTEEHASVDKKAMVVLSRTIEVRAEFSPDGNRVVTGAEDGTARVWDVGTGQPVGEVMEHESAVTAARFSLDGQRVVTVTREGKVQLWDPGTGKPEGRSITHGGGVLDAHFTDDGQQLVTVAHDHTARAWDPHTGEEQPGAVIHGRPVGAFQFSPDGRRWVEITPSHAARVWDLAAGEPVCEPFRDAGNLLLAAFGADGQSILTTSSSSFAHLWKPATTPAWPSALPVPPPDYAMNLDWLQPHFSPDGQRVLRSSADHTVRIWDANTGTELLRLKHETNVQWCEFSADGRKAIKRTSEGDLRVWDAFTGRPFSPLLKAEPSERQQLSPDGERVLRLTSDATATVWDTATGRPLLGPIEGWGHFAQFSSDGRRLISVLDTADKRTVSRLHLWDARTGVKLAQLEEPGESASAFFLQDPRRLVTFKPRNGNGRVARLK